jgi:hypothetical protein
MIRENSIKAVQVTKPGELEVVARTIVEPTLANVDSLVDLIQEFLESKRNLVDV